MKKVDSRTIEGQRRGLLAKVHIAKKELGLSDGIYREILAREFGVSTAAALSRQEMERLIDLFRSWGWIPQRGPEKKSHLEALRERIIQEAEAASFTGKRLRGLCRIICQTDDPIWCTDTEKLKRLLAALTKYRKGEGDEA
jgi:phage gp16-like protein